MHDSMSRSNLGKSFNCWTVNSYLAHSPVLTWHLQIYALLGTTVVGRNLSSKTARNLPPPTCRCAVVADDEPSIQLHSKTVWECKRLWEQLPPGSPIASYCVCHSGSFLFGSVSYSLFRYDRDRMLSLDCDCVLFDRQVSDKNGVEALLRCWAEGIHGEVRVAHNRLPIATLNWCNLLK